jgi:hypothetical protein
MNIITILSSELKLGITITLFVSIFWAGTTQAQFSVNSTGGDASGSGGSVAFSIGQVVYTTNTTNSGSIAQGVQHSYQINSLGINESTLKFSITAFPNPTSENLILNMVDYNNEKLTFALIDIRGKAIINEKIISHQTKINMTNLPSATYFIDIVNEANEIIQSFKIIKN